MIPLLVPRTSPALDLHWASGRTEQTFRSTVLCTLVVQAGVDEDGLPPEWRLVWVADSCEIHPLAQPCEEDVAQLSSYLGPFGWAELGGHRSTARFCSTGEDRASTARFVFELPGNGRGRLQVVALDPADADSSRVLESPVVDFNGGCSEPFPPIVLRVSRTHTSALLHTEVVGSNLAQVTQVRLHAPDGSTTPQSTIAQSDTCLILESLAPSAMPPCVLEFLTPQGLVASAALPGDVVLEEAVAAGLVPDFVDIDPNVRPKDFAFVHNTVPTEQPNVWRGLFHLIYIRHYNAGVGDGDNEVAFGHAWSRDLQTWRSDTAAFRRGGGSWDAGHVWAPSILTWRGQVYMFYTGVDGAGNQSIGYATTSLLDTTNTVWSRRATPTFTALQAHWAAHGGVLVCRDPFVLPDPEDPGELLMFYVAANELDGGRNSVGVAVSFPNSPDEWLDAGYYRSTSSISDPVVGRVESPHVFPDADYALPGQSSQATWRLMFTDGSAGPTQSIRFQNKTIGESLQDTTLAFWSAPSTELFAYLGSDFPTAYGWEATEYLKVGKANFLAAYNALGITFGQMYWSGPNFILGSINLAGGGPALPPAAGAPRLTLAEWIPGMGRVRMRVDMPDAAQAEVTVFDLAGRRVGRLLDRRLEPGMTIIEWPGRHEDGPPVPTGMYFARLTSPLGTSVLRLPLVR